MNGGCATSSNKATVYLLKALVVGRWPKQRRNFLAHETQVDGHLPAVVRPVIDRLLDHHVALLFNDHLSTREQFPVGPQMFIRGLFECRASTCRRVIQRFD